MALAKKIKSQPEHTYRTEPKNPGRRAQRWVKLSSTRIRRVVELLEDNLGEPLQQQNRPPLRVLVLTILSQNTTDSNALAAYENLLREFPGANTAADDSDLLPRDQSGKIDKVKIRMSRVADAFPDPDWSAMASASRGKIEELISPAGLQASKSSAIINIFDRLEEAGVKFDLGELIDDRPVEEAIDILTSMAGIGIKTAAVTLLESRGEDVCPVDTHVHRVSVRLGFVPPESTRKKTYRLLQEQIPEGKGYSLHHNLLSFGRSTCTARNPDCEGCFLNRLCRDYRCEQKNEEFQIKYTA